VIAALQGGPDLAGIHHVLSPDRLTWNDLFFRFAAHLGLGEPRPVGPFRLATESWLLAPTAQLTARFAGSAPYVVTPSMVRLFACRALPVSTRPVLLHDEKFHGLDAGLSEAAASLLKSDGAAMSPWRAPLACATSAG
jgi:hypothetical protein